MPKLLRLSGREVIEILREFGFEVVRIRGSHHRLMRVVGKQKQYITVPVHGKKLLSLPTLKSIIPR
jgi:predicted RNA binding protein YcfA (HicA-like mRNA interferase family)